MKFKELKMNDTFDFISPNNQINSFYDRCRKDGPRTYTSIDSGLQYRIGSINAKIYHVGHQTGGKII